MTESILIYAQLVESFKKQLLVHHSKKVKNLTLQTKLGKCS